ncbi:ESX secretion-associated protein EspG [Actinophytocola sediminis]
MSGSVLVLSAKHVDLLLEVLDLPRPPYPLTVPSVGLTATERKELTAEMFVELADRGLATGTKPGPLIASTLDTLCRYRIALDVVGYVDGEPAMAVAVVGDSGGLLAVQHEDRVRMTEIRPTAQVSALVGVLPQGKPGTASPMTVSYRAVQSAAGEGSALDDPFDDDDERVTLTRAGVSTKDASTLTTLAADRIGGGQFGVTVPSGRSSRTYRSPRPVCWSDTKHGRYLVVREDDWLSVSPADNDRIEHRVARLVTEATAQAS